MASKTTGKTKKKTGRKTEVRMEPHEGGGVVQLKRNVGPHRYGETFTHAQAESEGFEEGDYQPVE